MQKSTIISWSVHFAIKLIKKLVDRETVEVVFKRLSSRSLFPISTKAVIISLSVAAYFDNPSSLFPHAYFQIVIVLDEFSQEKERFTLKHQSGVPKGEGFHSGGLFISHPSHLPLCLLYPRLCTSPLWHRRPRFLHQLIIEHSKEVTI